MCISCCLNNKLNILRVTVLISFSHYLSISLSLRFAGSRLCSPTTYLTYLLHGNMPTICFLIAIRSMCYLSFKQFHKAVFPHRQTMEWRGERRILQFKLPSLHFCCFFDFTLLLRDMFCTPSLTFPYSKASCWHIIRILTLHYLYLTPLPLVKISCFLQPPACCRFPAPAWITHITGGQTEPSSAAECCCMGKKKKRGSEIHHTYFLSVNSQDDPFILYASLG